MSGVPCPKPRPAALEKADRRKALTARDEQESDAVRARSGGRCEAIVSGARCRRRAWHVHHLLGGIGVRGRGASALAENKIHLCAMDHQLVHRHILVHQGGKIFQHLR